MLPTASKGRTPSNVRPTPMLPQYLRRIVKHSSVVVVAETAGRAADGTQSRNTHNAKSFEILDYWAVTTRTPLNDLTVIWLDYWLMPSCSKWQQMDIEYTFWQMLHLCTSPKVVYQHTKYHKQTKNQWARDDPAFVVICSLLLAIATSAYCAAYDNNMGHAVFTVLLVVVFHFLVTGVILATCCWFLTNTYLREEASNSHVVEQHVEWLYAFDVHCNSFFPTFIMLYVIHYFVSPLLVAYGFIPVLLSNLLFMVSFCYYHYLNFLGYDVLPFLERTTFFLYPIGLIIILSPLLILSGFNPTRYIMGIYFS